MSRRKRCRSPRPKAPPKCHLRNCPGWVRFILKATAKEPCTDCVLENVPVQFPATLAGDGAVGEEEPHADPKIRSRTTQPRLNIGIRAPEWIGLGLSYTIPESSDDPTSLASAALLRPPLCHGPLGFVSWHQTPRHPPSHQPLELPYLLSGRADRRGYKPVGSGLTIAAPQ